VFLRFFFFSLSLAERSKLFIYPSYQRIYWRGKQQHRKGHRKINFWRIWYLSLVMLALCELQGSGFQTIAIQELPGGLVTNSDFPALPSDILLSESSVLSRTLPFKPAPR
jgi:hypothetical protein